MSILNMLYPQWFRKVRAVGFGESKKGKDPYIVMEYLDIAADADHKRAMELSKADATSSTEWTRLEQKLKENSEYQAFVQEMNNLGMYGKGPFGLSTVELLPINVVKDTNGHLRYLDTVDPFVYFMGVSGTKQRLFFQFIEPTLRQKIETVLEGEYRTRALAYLDNLERLRKELSEKLEKRI